MTTMATAMKIPDGGELKAQIEALAREFELDGIALAMGMAPDALIAWLDGKAHPKLERQVEKAAAAWLAARADWRARVDSRNVADWEGLKYVPVAEIERLVESLLHEKPDTPYGSMVATNIRIAVADFLYMIGVAREQADLTCWRCGAAGATPAAEPETQISINENAAAWAAWPRELFRAKLRAALKAGDRIVAIRGGAVVVRHADGTTLEVYLHGD
ncbi:MAG: hypothetical protein ACREQI_05220 [Candidatus Binataceae bacterium]